MKQFTLKYGKQDLTVSFPETMDITTAEPGKSAPLPDPEAVLQKALRSPIGKKPLSDCAAGCKKVGIIFNDITRATPTRMMLPIILNELSDIPADHIILFDALGTHRTNTPEELNQMLGEEIVRKYRIVQITAMTGLRSYTSGRPPLVMIYGSTGKPLSVICLSLPDLLSRTFLQVFPAEEKL